MWLVDKSTSLIDSEQQSTSLAVTLGTIFVLLSVLSLLVVGLFLLLLNFQTEQKLIAQQQQFVAFDAAQKVSTFITQRLDALEVAVQISHPFSRSPAEQDQFLQDLLTLQPALRVVGLVNVEGQEIAKQSRFAVFGSKELVNLANEEFFQQNKQIQPYISPIYHDEVAEVTMMLVAIPVTTQVGEFEGSLVAEINLDFIVELVASLQIGETGLAYVVDRQGNLVAFRNTNRVAAQENLGHIVEVAEFMRNDDESEELVADIFVGINGTYVVGTYIPLETPDWAVVTELPLAEAYQAILWNIGISIVILLAVTMIAAGVGVNLARRLADPLHNLTQTATRIAAGESTLQAPLAGPTEVRQLAEAFNSMTTQLQDLINSLEQRVTSRTHRLEIVANLSERLSSILDLDDLLQELVKGVKISFNYYHVQVYLLDNGQQNLLIAAAAGSTGAQMQAPGHHIPLTQRTNLVARAARTAEVVRVDQVHQLEDWQPNPLLPATQAEMALPIILEGQVVGVLDVQENQVAGFDESDAAILRSLTNQVAVAIRNARLFTATETALAESRAVQERYVEQSWQKSNHGALHQVHQYVAANAPRLPNQLWLKYNQLAQQRTQPTRLNLSPTEDMAFLESGQDMQGVSLVAPIKLAGKTIGSLQLHQIDEQPTGWREQDLALVEAVLDQVAQAAENIRLFDETRERATRQQVIREITDKLRTAPNLDTLLKIAVQELGHRLGVRHTVLELGIENPPKRGQDHPKSSS